MKRIKNFKLFESRNLSKNLSNSDKEYIREVLLDLSDDDIGIELDDLGFSPSSWDIDKDRPGLMIYIGFEYSAAGDRYNQTVLRDFSVYKDNFDHLKSFLDREGLEIRFIDLFSWHEDENEHMRLSNTKGDSGSQWSALSRGDDKNQFITRGPDVYNRFINSISGQFGFTGIRIVIN